MEEFRVTTATARSDTGWRAATGAILVDGVCDGETHDARPDLTDWSTAGYDGGGSAVEVVDRGPRHPRRANAPPIRRVAGGVVAG
ncbi:MULTISPECIES: alpha-L-rhamnosidase N-terminal domain-containing protein [Pseudofrankia]|uniref:alpha-L-rhamnosidase N-terminal domain-containing protein n=1 Tax=Pseudofrankia TaxID=2994363 RepID=UPI003CC9149A